MRHAPIGASIGDEEEVDRRLDRGVLRHVQHRAVAHHRRVERGEGEGLLVHGGQLPQVLLEQRRLLMQRRGEREYAHAGGEGVDERERRRVASVDEDHRGPLGVSHEKGDEVGLRHRA